MRSLRTGGHLMAERQKLPIPRTDESRRSGQRIFSRSPEAPCRCIALMKDDWGTWLFYPNQWKIPPLCVTRTAIACQQSVLRIVHVKCTHAYRNLRILTPLTIGCGHGPNPCRSLPVADTHSHRVRLDFKAATPGPERQCR